MTDVEAFLTELQGVLGPDYRRTVVGHFEWLTPFAPDKHEPLARQAEHALGRLANWGLPLRDAQRLPAILFDNTDDQLAYHEYFHQDGEAAPSIIDGGCFRSWPVGHLAIPVSEWDALDAAFAHELVHALLWDDGVPVWLQEGIACTVETNFGNRPDPLIDQWQWGQTVNWWRKQPSDAFWDASAFRNPASSQHAYALAQVLAGRWLRQPDALAALRAPGPEAWQQEDAVLMKVLGCDRAQALARILEPPRPQGWLARCFHAIFVGDEQR